MLIFIFKINLSSFSEDFIVLNSCYSEKILDFLKSKFCNGRSLKLSLVGGGWCVVGGEWWV